MKFDTILDAMAAAHAPDEGGRRRFRDHPVREGHADAAPDAAAQALARSAQLRRLRFEGELEGRFQADGLDERRQRALMCSVIGVIAIAANSWYLPQMVPDAVEPSLWVLCALMAWVVGGLCVYWRWPVAWRRSWHAELITAGGVLAVNAAVIAYAWLSQVDTAFTHQVTLVSTLMYACIAVRMRFRWSLVCALLTLLAFGLWVQGHTPQQVLIVSSVTKLMVLSYAFALVANYAFE